MCFFCKKERRVSIFLYFCNLEKHRGVAQLVARYVRDVEAGSSSLLTPTKKWEKYFSNTRRGG